MTPYIEDTNGNVYEFNNVSIKDKKDHEKKLQRVLSNITIKFLSKEEQEKILNPAIDAKEKEELLLKALQTGDISVIEEETMKVHIETFKTLLKKTKEPSLSDEEVDKIVQDLYELYGEDQVNDRIVKINDKVFTQVGEISYKEMPTWGLE